MTPDQPHWPCPYCGTQCIKKGFTAFKEQRYLCNACRRVNRELMPGRRNAPPNSIVLTCTFSLGPAATLALIQYCNRNNLTQTQAIRDIFYKAADRQYAVPTIALRSRQADGGVRTRLDYDAVPAPTVPLPRTLPNIWADVFKARMSRDPEIRCRPSVYVSAIVRVSLDEKAYRGLYTIMQRCGWNHQEAARFLITETSKPVQVPVAVRR